MQESDMAVKTAETQIVPTNNDNSASSNAANQNSIKNNNNNASDNTTAQNSANNSLQQNQSAVKETEIMDEFDIINEIEKRFFYHPEITFNECLPWRMSDGRIYGLQAVDLKNRDKKNEQYAKTMNSKLSAYFLENNFQKAGEDNIYSGNNRLKFEKGEIKCSLNWEKSENWEKSDKNSVYYYVSCAKDDMKDNADYQEIRALLLNDDYYQNEKEKNDMLVCIQKNDGSYARGIVGGIDDGGAGWFARKKAGKWEIADVSQEVPNCSKVGDFPMEVLGLPCENY